METFKHHSYIVPKATVGKSGLVLSVWGEQCHKIDENKQGANSGRKRSIFSIDIVNRIVRTTESERRASSALWKLRSTMLGTIIEVKG